MRVFVTGGTGLVGGRLIERLLARRDEVVLLTRRPEVAKGRWGERCEIVSGDPSQAGPWMDTIRTCDAAVNLAGQGLFTGRWNASFKELLRSSRVQGTTNVARAMAEQPRRQGGTAKVIANATAID